MAPWRWLADVVLSVVRLRPPVALGTPMVGDSFIFSGYWFTCFGCMVPPFGTLSVVWSIAGCS